MDSSRRNIRHLTKEELAIFIQTIGEKQYRTQQIYDWLWKNPIHSFEKMSNLSINLRNILKKEFDFFPLRTIEKQTAKDGTIKFLFQTHDGYFIEGVFIPSPNRLTACISSQVGCSVGCKFCATAQMKQKRNLAPDEMYDEVVLINNEAELLFNKGLTNIVFMGMGEPLLNLKSVCFTIKKIISPEGMGMSHNRVTISTSGISRQIKKLADMQVKPHLAISLHSAIDIIRTKLMPINKTNNLKSLDDAINYYFKKTKKHVSIEYMLLNKINDSLGDAAILLKFYRQVPARLLNIIEYNPVSNRSFQPSSSERMQEFVKYLQSKKVNVRLRRSRGKEIAAACGQLAVKDD